MYVGIKVQDGNVYITEPCCCYDCENSPKPGHFTCYKPSETMLDLEESGVVSRSLEDGIWRWFVNRNAMCHTVFFMVRSVASKNGRGKVQRFPFHAHGSELASVLEHWQKTAQIADVYQNIDLTGLRFFFGGDQRTLGELALAYPVISEFDYVAAERSSAKRLVITRDPQNLEGGNLLRDGEVFEKERKCVTVVGNCGRHFAYKRASDFVTVVGYTKSFYKMEGG